MRTAYLYTLCVCVYVLTCLSDLLIKNDLISNTRAKGIFVEAVEYMNKVVVREILK